MSSNLGIERFLPAINQYTRSVKKAYSAKGILVLVLFFMLLLGAFGFICSSDFVVAIAIASTVLLAFLFYLLHIYVKEGIVRLALATKERIDEIAAPDNLEAGEQAELYARLALSIRSLPLRLLKGPSCLSFLTTPCNRLIGYVAWQPLHTLSEVLFLSSINQHISRIKTAPTNLQYHASLANCYVMLANHYLEPMKTSPFMTWPGLLLTPRTRLILETKGRASSTSAIEELTILSSFAPDQLWVHDQLAISYRELEMPEREIEECETIIRLCPDDQQALLRLGTLYFRQGRNAKGLEVYERLKPIQPLLAEELISHYGAYKPLLESIPILS
jgi:tetratricopeptide (TPR) repeat protein